MAEHVVFKPINFSEYKTNIYKQVSTLNVIQFTDNIDDKIFFCIIQTFINFIHLTRINNNISLYLDIENQLTQNVYFVKMWFG